MANGGAIKLDAVFHALSDGTRRKVVETLADGPADVSTLAEPFALALPTFLKHLKVLEAAGLVETTKRGRVRHCALAPGALTEAERWVGAYVARWDAKLDGLERYLQQNNKDGSG